MATGRTRAALAIQEAAKPVLQALAGADPYDRAQIGDLLSTVTEKVLRKLHDGVRIDDLASYAKQTARNTFKDWLRSKQRHEGHTNLDGDEDSSSMPLAEHFARFGSSPSRQVIRRDDQRRHAVMIDNALANLTATERCVLDLRFREGRSSAEVADLLGYKSPAVVDTTVSRARNKLRAHISPTLMGLIRGLWD